MFVDQRLDDYVEASLEYFVESVQGQIDAVVCDAALGEIVGSDAFGAVATADLVLALRSALLVAAALLHDYGHIINNDDAEAAAAGRDQFHEEIAAEYERQRPALVQRALANP
mgnify:CR=1 FL=1